MATGVVTVGEIKTEALDRIDRQGSPFFGDSELNGYIARSYKELYDLLIQKFGDDYFFATPHQFTTDGTNDTFALPADFYKLYGVDLNLSAGGAEGWVTIRQFMKSDRNRYAVPNFQSFYGITNLRYRLRGDTIWFTPRPKSGQIIRLLYAPRVTDIVDDTSTIDGVSGWEEYIILDVAIKCAQKEESDVSVLAAQKAAIKQRIEEAAENRNVGEPQSVSDTQSNWGPFGTFSNGQGGFSY